MSLYGKNPLIIFMCFHFHSLKHLQKYTFLMTIFLHCCLCLSNIKMFFLRFYELLWRYLFQLSCQFQLHYIINVYHQSILYLISVTFQLEICSFFFMRTFLCLGFNSCMFHVSITTSFFCHIFRSFNVCFIQVSKEDKIQRSFQKINCFSK